MLGKIGFWCGRAVLASLAGLAVPGFAATFNAGLLPVGSAPYVLGGQVRPTSAGSFEDVFNFTLGEAAGVLSSLTNHPLAFSGPVYTNNIPDLKMSLFDANTNSLILGNLGPTTADQTAEALVPHLAAGEYRWVVTGTPNGVFGGVYTFTVAAVSPVPEPSSWVLYGIGALLAGYAARRKDIT